MVECSIVIKEVTSEGLTMSYEKKEDIQHRKIKTKSISEKYYSAIANIFTPSVIVNLINTGKSKYLS